MRNARLDEAQAGIKIVGRNISNLRYADDTTLMAESEEELKSLLQHHSSKASILQCSAFFMVQLSHPYMTIGKTIVLTRLDLCHLNNVSAFYFILFFVSAF